MTNFLNYIHNNIQIKKKKRLNYFQKQYSYMNLIKNMILTLKYITLKSLKLKNIKIN